MSEIANLEIISVFFTAKIWKTMTVTFVTYETYILNKFEKVFTNNGNFYEALCAPHTTDQV